MNTKPLPCPWCGRVPNVDDPKTFVTNDSRNWGRIECCGMPEVRTGYKPLGHWKEDAIEAWNTRVEVKSEIKLLEALQAAHEALKSCGFDGVRHYQDNFDHQLVINAIAKIEGLGNK